MVWNKYVPPKVHMHAWRVLWERIPTITQLQRRNVLPPNVNMDCVFCHKEIETVRHVLFECEVSYQVWMGCVKWMGVQSVFSSNPSTSLLHFSKLLRGKKGKILVVCLWECTIWLLWKKRNGIIFSQEQFSLEKLLEELKTRSWNWVVNKDMRVAGIEFKEWCLNPNKFLM
ncbi:hypothetical protein ACS0TY_017362 [Phlomoides rotata]